MEEVNVTGNIAGNVIGNVCASGFAKILYNWTMYTFGKIIIYAM